MKVDTCQDGWKLLEITKSKTLEHTRCIWEPYKILLLRRTNSMFMYPKLLRERSIRAKGAVWHGTQETGHLPKRPSYFPTMSYISTVFMLVSLTTVSANIHLRILSPCAIMLRIGGGGKKRIKLSQREFSMYRVTFVTSSNSKTFLLFRALSPGTHPERVIRVNPALGDHRLLKIQGNAWCVQNFAIFLNRVGGGILDYWTYRRRLLGLVMCCLGQGTLGSGEISWDKFFPPHGTFLFCKRAMPLLWPFQRNSFSTPIEPLDTRYHVRFLVNQSRS